MAVVDKTVRDAWREEGRIRAQETRNSMGLGSDPIPDIFALIEKQNVVLMRYPDDNPDFHAFYGLFEDVRVVYLNTREPLGRQVFSAAHELCHLLYDHAILDGVRCNPGQDQQSETEAIADAFAGEFLMPADRAAMEYLRRFRQRKPSEREVIELMYEFKVSYAAMAYTLFRAGIIKTGAQWNAIRQLGSVERHQDLRKAILRQGYAVDLVEPTAATCSRVPIEATIWNFDKHRITWGKIESVLEPWGKRPEDYGLRPYQDED
jgi:Zn-dependent peptidase ImmA (M78 family)